MKNMMCDGPDNEGCECEACACMRVMKKHVGPIIEAVEKEVAEAGVEDFFFWGCMVQLAAFSAAMHGVPQRELVTEVVGMSAFASSKRGEGSVH